jgi:hypothetical protein
MDNKGDLSSNATQTILIILIVTDGSNVCASQLFSEGQEIFSFQCV